MNVLPARARSTRRGGPYGFPDVGVLSLDDRRPAPKLMGAWRDAWRRQLNGHGQAHIACYGDSVTAGYNATSKYSEGWPSVLGGLMNTATGYTAGTGLRPFSNVLGGSLGDDPRFVETGTWATAIGVGYIGRCRYTLTAGSYVEFGPVNCESFRVFYLTDTAGQAGVFDLSIDGGTATRVDATTRPKGAESVTIAADGYGSHTLRVTYVSGTAFLLAVEGVAEPMRGVKVSSLSIGGADSSDFITNTNGQTSLTCVTSARPDLAIITLGTNDAYTTKPGERAFEANLHTAIDAFTAVGSSVMLGVANPMDIIEWRQYADAVRRVAAMRGCGLMDFDRAYVNRSNKISLYQDHIHQNTAGHAFLASLAANAVLTYAAN